MNDYRAVLQELTLLNEERIEMAERHRQQELSLARQHIAENDALIRRFRQLHSVIA